MTTTVKIHVNGNYRTTVRQGDQIPVVIDAVGVHGGVERSFSLSHPASESFSISEEHVDQNPADDGKE